MKKFFEKTTNLFGNKWLLFVPMVICLLFEIVRYFAKPSDLPWGAYIFHVIFGILVNTFFWIGWFYISDKNTDPYESDQEIADIAAADLNDGNLFMLLQAAVKQAIGTIQFHLEEGKYFKLYKPVIFYSYGKSYVADYIMLEKGEFFVSDDQVQYISVGTLTEMSGVNYASLLQLADMLELEEYNIV